MAHFSSGAPGAFAVEVDGCAGYGEGGACEVEVRPGVFWVGGAENVDHDGGGGGGGEGGGGRGEREVEDGAEVDLELGGRTGVDGVVARVVRPRCEFVDEEDVYQKVNRL